ncbi:hypothetical protein WJX79_002886 [Trebouxia sp. C0005]
MVQSRKPPADIALTPDETPTQRYTCRRDRASGRSNRSANSVAGNSALPNIAGAAAGAALGESINRATARAGAEQIEAERAAAAEAERDRCPRHKTFVGGRKCHRVKMAEGACLCHDAA